MILSFKFSNLLVISIGQSQNISIEELPVFVKPKNLKFCEKIISSHRQIFTIYNPYQFVIKYKSKLNNCIFL